MRVIPTAELVRQWSNDLLNDHLAKCYPGSGYVCAGCADLNRKAFEKEAVLAGDVICGLAEGWL